MEKLRGRQKERKGRPMKANGQEEKTLRYKLVIYISLIITTYFFHDSKGANMKIQFLYTSKGGLGATNMFKEVLKVLKCHRIIPIT